MTKDEFFVLNNLFEASTGRAVGAREQGSDIVSEQKETLRKLTDRGFINASSGEITKAGEEALEPYRVDNAVILAAGSATRFIPLSLEQPKGLYEVRGEKLIERQIQQLQEAGVRDITVVLGYKKDMFAYLEGKYQVRLLFNPAYNVKNNIESLWVAKDYLKNTYICVCDSYFTANPFHQYEYHSFYAGFTANQIENEMYALVNGENRILAMERSRSGWKMLLGHSYWQKDFSDKFIALAEEDREKGDYDNKFWEWLVKDHLDILPAFYFKEYTQGTIFEFDYFEQLRLFDNRYVSHAHSEILRNIKLVFRCDEEDIADFRTVNEGLTNTSFIFRIKGEDYIYRHPGDGTESIINRRNEKSSLMKAKEFGIDPTYIYMDVIEGWKISRYVDHFREPDYSDFEDSKKIAAVLQKLHSLPIKADYGMRPWEDAVAMEHLLRKQDENCFHGYTGLKERIYALYQKTIGDGIEKCFCHGDTYRPNWMLLDDGEVILIDWEYSGYSDPGIDVGYYIVDAMYEFEDARKFIREYLGDDWTKKKEFHYMVYTAVIAYYWFVWALYRESCGANMGEALPNWHKMAEKYSMYLLSGQASPNLDGSILYRYNE